MTDESKHHTYEDDMTEYCVICGNKTEYTIETPIDHRKCYVVGVGQLCVKCYLEIFNDEDM